MSRNLSQKYRPRTIEELIAPDSLKGSLEAVLKSKKRPTALLFSGTSGCGKTTMGRMFARYANCDTGNACGECESCLLLDTHVGAHPDVLEINAAEQRGIDDMRSLISNLNFSPMHRHRVIILDECHMLTPQAMQPLLKVTEDPPATVTFVLCTTNPEKLPTALVGRCIRFRVTPADPEEMIAPLARICVSEKVKPEKGSKQAKQLRNVLTEIAMLSNGQWRDAILMLDQVLGLLRAAKSKDLSAVFDSYLKHLDIADDELAVSLLTGLYIGPKALAQVVKNCYGNETAVRSVVRKMGWANDKLLRETVGARVPFVDSTYRLLKDKLKKYGSKADTSVDRLLRVQNTLVELELQMNSTSIPEITLLTNAVYRVCAKS